MEILYENSNNKLLLNTLELNNGVVPPKTNHKESEIMKFTNLTNLLHHIVDDLHVPFVQCQVYKEGKEVYNHGYGDAQKDTPVTPQHTYNLYSTTKFITCTAALQLLEQGKYIMTDPLYEYFPQFKDMLVKVKDINAELATKVVQGQKVEYKTDNDILLVEAKRPILIKDVFNMTAGFNYDRNAQSFKDIKEETEGRFPTLRIADALANNPLSYQPGEKWGYSLGHDLLGAFVELVSGMKFGEYLKKNIFEPLGMDSFTFERNEKIYSKMAEQYQYDYETKTAHNVGKGNPHILGTEFESGGAGLAGSAEDYGKFVTAMSLGGISPKGERILSEHTVDLMRTNCLNDEQLKFFNWSQLIGYGYGYGVRTHMDRAKSGGLSPVGEFGWGGAAGAYAMVDKDNQIAVFYGQHMLNNLEPYIHPRIRNAVYSSLDK